MTQHYLNSLSDADREELFAFMRTIDQEAEKFMAEHRRLCPPPLGIAVGAAHFDPWLKVVVIWDYCSRLRNGLTPTHSREGAIAYGRECVRTHNQRRPRDINWQRWEDSTTWWVDNIYERTPKPHDKD